MALEKMQISYKRGRFPYINIMEMGRMYLNRFALELIGSPGAVDFFIDKRRRMILLAPGNDISISKIYNAGLASITRVLNNFKIKPGIYKIEFIDGMIAFKYNEPIKYLDI